MTRAERDPIRTVCYGWNVTERGTIMRRDLICYAVVALIITSTLTIDWWDTVIDLHARHQKYDRIREGMTEAEVEAIMGERGVPQPLKISGSWGEMWGLPSKSRWDDAYFTVDVRFFPGLSRGAPATVTQIIREPRTPPALLTLCFQRGFLASLWLFSVALLLRGLRTPKSVRIWETMMRRVRIRNVVAVVLLGGALVVLWFDTVRSPTSTERIQPGMTLRQVQSLMRDSGKPQFLVVSGDPEGLQSIWTQYGFPRRYRWEDASTMADVTFQAPEPKTPVVVSIVRKPKATAGTDELQPWRLFLALFILLGLVFAIRGLLTAKPIAALNSPPTSDTKDGADSPTD